MSSAGAERSPQPTTNPNSSPEWISIAGSWLSSTFSNEKSPSMSEFEAWFDRIAASLPEDVKSTPRSQLYQNLMADRTTPPAHQEHGSSQSGTKHAKFQRTDQWQPVYSWLESLNKEEVVRSEDIAEWLEKNPGIKEDLSAKHSRYHLMHYVKKCHFKILKRRNMKKIGMFPFKFHKKMCLKLDKGYLNRVNIIDYIRMLKGLPVINKPASEKSRKRKDIPTRELIHFSSAPMTNVPKNDDLLLAKRNEALQKFEILIEFEKRLLAQFPRSELTTT